MDISQLLILLIGAVIGAYVTWRKNKWERLWKERFEALKEICTSAEIMTHGYDSDSLGERGIRTMSNAEYSQLTQEALEARKQLRKAMASISLLFKEKDVNRIKAAYIELNGSILDIHNVHPSEDAAEELLIAAEKATKLLEESKALARKKLL